MKCFIVRGPVRKTVGALKPIAPVVPVVVFVGWGPAPLVPWWPAGRVFSCRLRLGPLGFRLLFSGKGTHLIPLLEVCLGSTPTPEVFGTLAC